MERLILIVLLYSSVFIGKVATSDHEDSEGNVSTVRLVGGSDSFEGRVEVFYKGSWSTICDDRWDIRDASVICAMLGHLGARLAPGQAFFGEGTGPILLDEVLCSGSEADIRECDHNGYLQHNCVHSEDAGAVCSNKTVRLLGGDRPDEGTVEILYNNSWFSVCDDEWDDLDATVVCRMLGYNGSSYAVKYAHYGEASGDILLDNVRCSGDEEDILDCPHEGLLNHNCHHSEDAGVVCSYDINEPQIILPSGPDISPTCPESCAAGIHLNCYCDAICLHLGDCCRDFDAPRDLPNGTSSRGSDSSTGEYPDSTEGRNPDVSTGSTPGGTTGATPGGTTCATPGGTTYAATGATPGGTTVATPGRTTGVTPGGTTGATPGRTTGATPGGTTVATSGGTSSATPGGTTGATPGGTTGATPGGTTGATPGGTICATPGGTTGTTLGGTTVATPGGTGGTPGWNTGATPDDTGATPGITTDGIKNDIPGLEYWSCIGVPTGEGAEAQWILVVGKCPQDYTNSSIREKCERLSIVGVLTDGFGVYFLNKFCADCHGLSDHDQTLLYAFTDSPSNPGNLSGHVLQQTYYRIAQLNDSIQPPRRCVNDLFNPVIKYCTNNTFANNSIITLCQSFSSLIHVDGIPYKNKYCAACNNAIDISALDSISECPPSLDIEFPVIVYVEEEILNEAFSPIIFRRKRCPVGRVLHNGKCRPEDSRWPPCEHIYTSYTVTRQMGFDDCFRGVGQFENHVDSGSSLVTSSNGTHMYYWDYYHVADFDLPPRDVLESGINNSTWVFTTHLCSEREISLQQSCLVSGQSDSGYCSESLFVGFPDSFQPLLVNGSILIYHNTTRIIPAQWENVTTYTYSEKTQGLAEIRELRLCGRPKNVLDCAAKLENNFQLMDERNTTYLILDDGVRIPPEKYGLFPNGSALICFISGYAFNSRPQIILSHIAFGFSIVCLLATLVTYMVHKPLRNLQGLIIMNFIIALLMAQVILEYLATYVLPWSPLCQTVGVLAHFFFLAAFCWMTTLAWNLCQSFSAACIKTRAASETTWSILRYAAFGWILPAIFTASCLAVHLWGQDTLPLRYGGSRCWVTPYKTNIVVFLVPLAISLLLNTAFFIQTVRKIRASRNESALALAPDKKGNKQDLLIYIKISSLMGFSWVVGFVETGIQSPVMLYIFSIVSSAQGILIFWSFATNQRVRGMWRDLLVSRRNPTATQKMKSTCLSGASDITSSV